MKSFVGLSLGLGLIISPAYAQTANIAGVIVVHGGYPGATDNPGCYIPHSDISGPFTSSQAKLLKSGVPCKTIQYACDLALTNPGNNGPGPANDPQGRGASWWRVIVGNSVNTSGGTAQVYYKENVICKGSGIDAGHPFYLIGRSAGTPATGTIAGQPTLRMTGSHTIFGKIDMFNNNGEGVHIESLDGSRLTDVTVFYNTTISGNAGAGLHVVGVDGLDAGNSINYSNNAVGKPCTLIENTTMWHMDHNSIFRCGSRQGYGIEAHNSPGGTVADEHKKIENPPDVKADLLLDHSPNATIDSNSMPFSCVVTPPSDLATDTFINNPACATQ